MIPPSPRPAGRPSLKLFENPILERLSHVHPATPALVWIPVIAFLTYRSFGIHQMGAFEAFGIAVLGILAWSLFEYSMHRFIFHWKPESAWGKRFIFIMHGNHHDDPQDPSRLVMPPAAGILIALPLFFLFRAVFGLSLGEWFFATFMLGYLCYDYTHFAVHFFRPRTGLGRWIKRYHMHHHFSTPEARWGVSSPLWDYVFGSTGEKVKTGIESNIPGNDARISSS